MPTGPWKICLWHNQLVIFQLYCNNVDTLQTCFLIVLVKCLSSVMVCKYWTTPFTWTENRLLFNLKLSLTLAFHSCCTHMYTNTCSADTEKGRIGTFFCLFALLRNSNPFQDFLIEKLESLCYSTLIHSLRLNCDGFVTEATHELSGPYPLSLSCKRNRVLLPVYDENT